MVENVLEISGVLMWIAVGAMALAVVAGLSANLIDRMVQRIERLARADERRRLGNDLISHSWWFSEDRVTMNLLAAAGRDMTSGHSPLHDISVERERWRDERRKRLDEGSLPAAKVITR